MTYSSKLSSHYLELAEQPISKDVFAGEDVRFSSEYEALENELGKALSLHENGQTDWLKILENSEALLRAQSKDLRVAAWLTWALYQRESFPGLLAGLGLLERLCSRHWVEIHPLKARTRAAAIAWLVPRLEQALNENVPIKEQLPLFRRLAEHLEKLDTALTAQLGDDAPLLLPISRRLSGMLQRAADNQPEPGVVGAVVAQVKQAASQLLAPGAPIDNERDAHKAMRAQQEAARPLCAWWLKQKATDLRALRLNRTMLWLPIESMPERNAEQVTALRGVPADKLKSYQERFAQGLYADLLVELEASLARAPFWFDGQRLVWECLQGSTPSRRCGKSKCISPCSCSVCRGWWSCVSTMAAHSPMRPPAAGSAPMSCPISRTTVRRARSRPWPCRPNGTSPWTRSSRCCARTA